MIDKKLLKVLSLTDEEHEFLLQELSEYRIRSQKLLDDSQHDYDYGIDSKDNIDLYKKEVRLFDAIIKKL